MKEKAIKDYPRYIAYPDGRVKSLFTNKFLKPLPMKSGYYRYFLRNEEGVKPFLVHRIIAKTFIDNPNGKRTVNHIDGDKSNNSVGNLEWSTYSENQKHAYNTGLASKQKSGVSGKVVVDSDTGIFYDSCKAAHDSKSFKWGYSYTRSMLNGRFENKTSLMYV